MSKQHKLVLIVAILASFVAFLDGSVVNVALPAIQRELGGGLVVQQWVVDAYLISLGGLILIAGSLSDLFGRKKILGIGLIGFLVTSLICALAPSSIILIIARLLQGAAGALIVPSSLAIIISTFPKNEESKAIGTWTAWTGISFIIGPLVGGFLVDFTTWRYVFAINVIPILITLWLLKKVQEKQQEKSRSEVDFIGALLCSIGLGASVYGLIELPRYGWTSAQIFMPIIIGVMSLIAFLFYEHTLENPMLPLSLFKRRNFTVGNIATLSIYASLSALTFLLIVFIQQVEGYSALKAGLSILPVTIIMFFLSPRFGGLSGKYGPRFFMGFGPIIAGLGFLLMLRVNATSAYWTSLFPGIIIFGIGLSMTVAPLTAAILGDVGSKHAGIASAINNAVARIAGLLAIAAIGAVVASHFSTTLSQEIKNQPINGLTQAQLQEAKSKPLIINPPRAVNNAGLLRADLSESSVRAFHYGTWVIAFLVISGGIISLIGIQNPKKQIATPL